MGTYIPLRQARSALARRRAAARVGRGLGFLRRYGGLLALIACVGFIAIASQPRAVGHAPASRDTDAKPGHTGFVVRVLDGDTLHVDGQRIRLDGIDAPELSQTCLDAQSRPWDCGQAARLRLAALVWGVRVACSPQGQDRYGRTLAVCSAGDIADIGAALVREGLAVNYDRYTSAYRFDQLRARAAGRGLWQGEFQTPEQWRHSRRRSGA